MIKIMNEYADTNFLKQSDLQDGRAYIAWYNQTKIGLYICNRYENVLAFSVDGKAVIGREYSNGYKFKEVNLEVRFVQ